MAAHSVLIVHENEDDRNAYARLLRDEPVLKDVRTAPTVKEGLGSFRQAPADCVLLDDTLLGDDSQTVLEDFRSLDSRVPIVMLTGECRADASAIAAAPETVDHVAKDQVSAFSLRQTIVHVIQKADLLRKIDSQKQEQHLFLRTLIHDARAPLRHIRTFIELLDEDIRSENYDEVLEHSEVIAQATGRIQDLINTLSAYALSEGKVEFDMVSMNDVADAAISNLAQTIEERAALVTHADLPTVTGHASQLVQVLQNLIGNGIKYCDADSPEVVISADRNDMGRWQFQVRDNGIGIPADRLDCIFEPFRRLWSQDVYEGTGLGLAICRKIIERHGGRIWCRSENDKGSTFLFTLGNPPTSAAPAPADQAQGS